MRALFVLLVTAVAATLNIVLVRAWWRAAIAKRRSGLLWLLLLPLIATFTLGPIFAVGTTAAWAFPQVRPWHVWFVFSCMMLWLASIIVVSFRYSQRYGRTHPAKPRNLDATRHV